MMYVLCMCVSVSSASCLAPIGEPVAVAMQDDACALRAVGAGPATGSSGSRVAVGAAPHNVLVVVQQNQRRVSRSKATLREDTFRFDVRKRTRELHPRFSDI